MLFQYFFLLNIPYNHHVMLNRRFGLAPIIATLLLLCWATHQKQHSIQFSVPAFRRSESWSYVDRMRLDPGQMNLKSTIKFLSSNYKQGARYDLELVAIP